MFEETIPNFCVICVNENCLPAWSTLDFPIIMVITVSRPSLLNAIAISDNSMPLTLIGW